MHEKLNTDTLFPPFSNASNVLISYWDDNLICRFASVGHQKWFNLEPADMIGKLSLKDLFGDNYTMAAYHVKTTLNGTLQQFELDLRLATRTFKRALINLCPDFAENGKVLGFYAYVCDAASGMRSEGASSLLAQAQPLSRVIQTLTENLLNGFPGMNNLAQKHHISVSKLKRDFKITYQKGVLEYYRLLQMELADDLIRSKKYSIKQLAALFNFSNPHNFSISYKKFRKEKELATLNIFLHSSEADKYKIFVKYASFCSALFDNQLRLVIASEKWLDIFGFKSERVTNRHIYELFPFITEAFKKQLEAALLGTPCSFDRQLYPATMAEKWIHCEFEPIIKDQQIFGIVSRVEDYTEQHKQFDQQNLLLNVLQKANDMSQLGAWQIDLDQQQDKWNPVTCQILDVAPDTDPNQEKLLHFFSMDKKDTLIKKMVERSLQEGATFDVVTSILTAKGRRKLVRIIAYPERQHRSCSRLYGICYELPQIDF